MDFSFELEVCYVLWLSIVLNIAAVTISPIYPEKNASIVTITVTGSGSSVSWVRDGSTLSECFFGLDFCLPNSVDNMNIGVVHGQTISTITISGADEIKNGGLYEAAGSSALCIISTPISFINWTANTGTFTAPFELEAFIHCVYPIENITISFELKGDINTTVLPRRKLLGSSGCQTFEHTLVAVYYFNSSYEGRRFNITPVATHELLSRTFSGPEQPVIVETSGMKSTCQVSDLKNNEMPEGGDACWLVPFLSVLIVGVIVFIGLVTSEFARDRNEDLRQKVYRCILIVTVILCSTGLIAGLIAGLLRINGVTGFCCEVWNIVVSTVLSVTVLSILIVFIFILLLIWKNGKNRLAKVERSESVVTRSIHDKEKSPRIPSTGRIGRISPNTCLTLDDPKLSFLSMVPKDRELPHPNLNSSRSESGQQVTKPHHIPPLHKTINGNKEIMTKKRKKGGKKVKKDKGHEPFDKNNDGTITIDDQTKADIKDETGYPMLTDSHEQLSSREVNALKNIAILSKQNDKAISSKEINNPFIHDKGLQQKGSNEPSLTQQQATNDDKNGKKEKKFKKDKSQTLLEGNNDEKIEMDYQPGKHNKDETVSVMLIDNDKHVQSKE